VLKLYYFKLADYGLIYPILPNGVFYYGSCENVWYFAFHSPDILILWALSINKCYGAKFLWTILF